MNDTQQKIDTFDPERAGFVKGHYPGDWENGDWWVSKEIAIEGDLWWIGCDALEILEDPPCLPADLPHDTVLRILRANGYEGGEG